ncbi:MAG: hypothetical protein SF187_29045 [Deltaproteobacteria bacterium]|nr:hypothetical protein [Deltaproteobacteria bacterium]
MTGRNSLNQKVLIWARGKRGRKVGRGECWDLADQALHHAGALSSTTTGKDDDYVWGTLVETKDLLPGDVLQFRDFVIVTKTKRTITFSAGGGFVETAEETAQRGHHTAIVDSVIGDGQVNVLEQHVKPLGQVVQKHRVYLRSIKRPSLTKSETVADESGRRSPAKVIEDVEIIVSGKVWAYRPNAK